MQALKALGSLKCGSDPCYQIEGLGFEYPATTSPLIRRGLLPRKTKLEILALNLQTSAKMKDSILLPGECAMHPRVASLFFVNLVNT